MRAAGALQAARRQACARVCRSSTPGRDSRMVVLTETLVLSKTRLSRCGIGHCSAVAAGRRDGLGRHCASTAAKRPQDLLGHRYTSF